MKQEPRFSSASKDRDTAAVGMIAFAIGATAGIMYLAMGGEYFFAVPRWAQIVFYPGFIAGYRFHEWGFSEDQSIAAGVVALGLAYALIAMIVWRCCRI